MKKLFFLTAIIALVVLGIAPVAAHDAPAVEVDDQVSLDGSVVVRHVASEGQGFIVIHADNGGAPGAVIGYAPVQNGENDNVRVWIDAAAATPVLYAMLHADTNEIGVYEFGTVEGADGPAVDADNNVVTPAFNVQLIYAEPQFVNGSFTAANVVTDAPGFLVVHAEQDGSFGAVLGAAPVAAGNNANVTVTLEGDVTANVFPMLHVDTGEAGVYEFGTVEGADGPIAVNGVVATTSIAAAPTIVAHDQVIVHGDNYEMMDDMEMMAPTFHASAVLSEGPGFLVVHADNGGAPGAVLGYAPVADGLNTDVMVELSADGLTPVVFPMLHVDTGEVGTYEFGTVEGADGPVRVNDAVVTFPVNIAPSYSAADQSIMEGHITIDSALIDAPGWLVIHASVDGAPGAVLGVAKLNQGVNSGITIDIDPASVDGAAVDQVFPMLHYDTGEAGAYEFGTVEGADGPVSVGGNVVVGPLALQ